MSELSGVLPILLSEHDGFAEPSVSVLGKKAQKSLARLEVKRRRLQQEDTVASGTEVRIIASGRDKDGRVSRLESADHAYAAERVMKLLDTVEITEVVPITNATHADFMDALDDPSVSDIIYIGHSERSNLILDKTVTWKSAAERMTHLKHSIGVLGCSTSYKGTISPRLGGLLLPDDGVLYGKHSEAAYFGDIGALGRFYELEHHMADFNSLDFGPYMTREERLLQLQPA